MKFQDIILISLISFTVLVLLSSPYIRFSGAGSSSNTLTANVNVGNVIYLSVSPNTINFGSLLTGESYSTNALATDTDNGGNIGSNILVEGSNWVLSTNSLVNFGVSNTLWSNSVQTSYTGTALSNSFQDTNIPISEPTLLTPSTSNSIYFGLSIPGGTPPGNYVETISFKNYNSTLGIYNKSSSANSITADVQVSSTCYISLSTNSISFGSVYASANVPTNVVVNDVDNGGDAQASLLLNGTAWSQIATPSITFGVSNTLWNPTSEATYTGTQLTGTLVNSGITIPAPTLSTPSTSNSIYFGLGVPGGTPAGTYKQVITIENTC